MKIVSYRLLSSLKKITQSRPLFLASVVSVAWVLSATASLNAVAQPSSIQTVNTPSLSTTQLVQSGTVLSIVQVCKKMARGGGCQLLFVPTQNELTPAGNIHATCAPGWLAYLSVEQGTVEQGGVNRGEAVVCGYADAASVLKAVIGACNEQNLGMCSQASRIDMQWAFWHEKSSLVATLPLNQAVDMRSFEQFQICQSTVPIVASSTCSTQASHAARLAGFK
jgi:hypothetical protein